MYKKPSISELLDLLNKPALLYWANDLGLKGKRLREVMNANRRAGTSLHSQVRAYVEKKQPFADPIHQQNFVRFMDGKCILDMEQKVETEWFQGRYDARMRVGADLFVCDFKSNSRLYLEQKLQLVAYKMALGGEYKMAVVHVPEFKFSPVDIPDTSELEEVLKNLSFIHKIKTKYEL